MGSGLSLAFDFYTCTTTKVGVSHVTHFHKSIYRVFRWGEAQQAEAGRNVYITLRKSLVFVYSTLTLVSTPSPKALSTFIGDFHLFHPTCVWFVLHFCICHMIERSSTPPLTRSESSWGSPAVFSHELIQTLSRDFTKELAGESPEPLTWTFALSHTATPEIIRSSVQRESIHGKVKTSGSS